MKSNHIDDSFCIILDPMLDNIMTIHASITTLNLMPSHLINDDVKLHLKKIERSINGMYDHIQKIKK